MELKLENGAYVTSSSGRPETGSGAEETAQRVLLRLTARRGGFAPLPEYGSRLYLLPRTAKPSGYETAARQYIAEALAEEPAVEVTAVRFTPVGADGVRIDVDFTAGGAAFTGAVTV